MSIYYPIIIKLALGIICLIFQINIMGKGNLAPTSALDQVQNYVLGGIIGGVIYNDSISVMQFMLVLIIWTTLVLIIKTVKENNRLAKKIIDGQPTVLISNGTIDIATCLKHGISANDLTFKLRTSGVYEVSDVKRAVLEQNGQLTVIQKGDDTVHYPVIVDGQINEDALDMMNKSVEWLVEEVHKLTDKQISEIYLGEYDQGQLKLYIYKS